MVWISNKVRIIWRIREKIKSAIFNHFSNDRNANIARNPHKGDWYIRWWESMYKVMDTLRDMVGRIEI